MMTRLQVTLLSPTPTFSKSQLIIREKRKERRQNPGGILLNKKKLKVRNTREKGNVVYVYIMSCISYKIFLGGNTLLRTFFNMIIVNPFYSIYSTAPFAFINFQQGIIFGFYLRRSPQKILDFSTLRSIHINTIIFVFPKTNLGMKSLKLKDEGSKNIKKKQSLR